MTSRCAWAKNELAIHYHDTEWGVPLHDERTLFELLILEGAQAGLSWDTILSKRENYRTAYDDFEVQKVAKYSDAKYTELLQNAGIIRNRLKISASFMNARCFIQIQQEFGSFDAYLWRFVANQPIINHWQTSTEVPTSSSLSDTLSQDLKRRGFRFTGTTIIYAYLQSTGVINDHTTDCFRWRELSE